MRLGLPLMCFLLPVMLVVLYTIFRPRFGDRVSIAEVHIPWTTPRIMALVLFACTALAWIFSSRLARGLHIASADTVIALMAAILVVALGLANWRQISENTDWGVLYLFGGGLTLSAVLRASGASAVLGQQVAALIGGVSPLVMYLIVAIFIVFLTEFTSNTASAALLVPVFAAIAEQMGLPPKILVLMIGFGASLAFMMPVATPPNAIVFASGHIRQRDMLRAGVVLNLLCSVLLATWGWLFF
jgi:sodium-dependent dicarboxylate transporter 2/3/5